MLHESLARRARALIIFVLAIGGLAHAQEPLPENMRSAAEAAQALGNRINHTNPTPQVEAGGENDMGTAIIKGDRIPINQISPGGATPASVEALKSLHGDRDRLESDGRAKMAAQARDPNDAAAALRATSKTRAQMSSDLARDRELFRASAQALTPGNPLQQGLGQCTATTRYVSGRSELNAMTYQETCEELAFQDHCTRVRELNDHSDQVSVIDVDRGDITFSDFVSQDLGSKLPDGAKIMSVDLTLTWEGNVANVIVVNEPSLANNWTAMLGIVYNQAAQVCTDPNGATCTAGDPNCTCAAQWVHATYAGTINYVQETISSDPPNCLLDTDQWCTAQWACSDDTPRTVFGIDVGTALSGQLGELYPQRAQNRPPSSLSPICYRAAARYDCPYQVGNLGCWTGADGLTHCFENAPGGLSANTCMSLRQRMDCHMTTQRCNQDARGYMDFCYVYTDTFNCDEYVNTPIVQEETHFTCTGTARCMGEECVKPPTPEQQRGLAQAQASLMLVQHMLADYTFESTTNRNARRAKKAAPKAAAATNDPKVFPGTAYTCRKALGGTLNTCGKTETSAVADWMDLYVKHERQGNANAAAANLRAQGEPEEGSWSKLAEPQQQNYATMSQALTSKLENITGGADANKASKSAKAGGTVIGTTAQIQPMSDYFKQYARENYTNSRTTWFGTDEEWELANQRELGSCSLVGAYCKNRVLGMCAEEVNTYCCFNSPISKKVRDQLADNNPDNFGTPRNPNCDGVTMQEATSEKAAKTDLTDWIARMGKAGVLPTPDNVQGFSDVDRLTGSGSSFDDHTRKNAIVRTSERVAAIPQEQVYGAVEVETSGTVAHDLTEEAVEGNLAFSPALTIGQPGQPVVISVRRYGTRGRVGVGYSTSDGTGIVDRDYRAASGALVWEDGETGLKTFTVQLLKTPDTIGVRTINLTLSAPFGGARLFPNGIGAIHVLYPDTLPVVDPLNQPRVAAYKSTLSATVPVGQFFEWYIEAQNFTRVTDRDVWITDILPRGIQMSDVVLVRCDNGASGTVEQLGDLVRVSCPARDLAPGASGNLMVRIRGLAAGTYANHCEVFARPPTILIDRCFSTITVH